MNEDAARLDLLGSFQTNGRIASLSVYFVLFHNCVSAHTSQAYFPPLPSLLNMGNKLVSFPRIECMYRVNGNENNEQELNRGII